MSRSHQPVDLTASVSPPAPPRPTIANVDVQPRRRLRDGSLASSSASSSSASAINPAQRRRVSPSRSIGTSQSDNIRRGRPRANADHASASTISSRSSSSTSHSRPAAPTAPTAPTAYAESPEVKFQGQHFLVSEDDDDDDEIQVLAVRRSPMPAARKKPRLDKGKGKAKVSEDLPKVDFYPNEPTENLLSAFQCPICLSPPTGAVLTPCGHIMCGACLFATLKSQAIRERRRPTEPGQWPPKLDGKKVSKPPEIKGRIVMGNCPVCRHEIENGMGTIPGEGGVKYLEIKMAPESIELL